MTAGTMIDYEALTQDALRGVVRAVLSRAAKSGLPGDHHFYISFHTLAPGVTLSKRLREKYPSEMTIVLQHRFWDLSVTDDRFDVKLTFDGVPERIIVPFSALKVFFDPSVRYGMQFGEPDGESGLSTPLDLEPHGADGSPPPSGGLNAGRALDKARSAAPRRPRIVKKARGGKEPKEPETAVSPARVSNAPDAPEPSQKDERAGNAAASGAEIVRLDMFRKK